MKSETGVPRVFLPMHGLVHGTDNQGSVAVGPLAACFGSCDLGSDTQSLCFPACRCECPPALPACQSVAWCYLPSLDVGYLLPAFPSSLFLTRGPTPRLSQSSHLAL